MINCFNSLCFLNFWVNYKNLRRDTYKLQGLRKHLIDTLRNEGFKDEDVLNAMMSNDLFGRPDNYYELLADKYRGQTRASLDAAVRAAIDPHPSSRSVLTISVRTGRTSAWAWNPSIRPRSSGSSS
mgnify:CR=1 FL=1